MSRAESVDTETRPERIPASEYDDMAQTLRAEGHDELADRFERIADRRREVYGDE